MQKEQKKKKHSRVDFIYVYKKIKMSYRRFFSIEVIIIFDQKIISYYLEKTPFTILVHSLLFKTIFIVDGRDNGEGRKIYL